VVTVRPFNTFGPRQSARAIVPTIITQMLRSDHVCLGFLEPTRDLTFVRDTVRGFLLAAQAADAAGHVFNPGYGAEISIGNLIRLIADVVGKSVSVVTEQHRTRPLRSEVMRLLSDNSLAREKWAGRLKYRCGKGWQLLPNGFVLTLAFTPAKAIRFRLCRRSGPERKHASSDSGRGPWQTPDAIHNRLTKATNSSG
jgi:hypothetical protein